MQTGTPPFETANPRGTRVKATKVLFLCGTGLLLAIFFVGIYLVPKLQSGNSGTARQSDAARVTLADVFLDVTYATPEFVKRVKLEPYIAQYQNRAQAFLVGINTHVGTIADLDLRNKVLLEDSNGDRYPSMGTPVVLSEHHNMYLLVFPLLDNHGKSIFAKERGHFRLVVEGVGKTAERVFEWKLPVVEAAPAKTLANTLMLALGVVGALMVILSPCAIELTTYYTGIIAGVVSSAAISTSTEAEKLVDGKRSKRIPAEVRGKILRNLGAFVLGFTMLYMASGATVAFMGQHLIGMQEKLKNGATLMEVICGVPPKNATTTEVTIAPTAKSEHATHANHGPGFGNWTKYANWLGASFLIYFALKSVGILKRGGQCFVWLGQFGRKMRLGIAWLVGLVSEKRAAIIRAPAFSMRQKENITPTNSFCAGLGLSVSCLTCMGGAILYPLLIFVGTSTWYWGALILGTYSIALALPMAAIAVAVGNWSWQFVHRPGLTRTLQWTSATVMICVAILIVTDRTRFINSVVFTVLSALGGNPDPAFAKL
jgi:cytochrome c biogenesis protein CcdA